MTVIAYKDGIMAADTMGTWSSDKSFGYNKIGRTKNFTIGFAGDFTHSLPMFDWIKEQDNKGFEPLRWYQAADKLFEIGDLATLIVGRDQRIWYARPDGTVARVLTPYEAVGSGGRIALGAMHAGASAEEAVRAAMTHDVDCGGDVVTVHVSATYTEAPNEYDPFTVDNAG